METSEIIDIMEANFNTEHGVINLRQVEKELREKRADVAKCLLDFCQSPEVSNFFAYSALGLLYSLAIRGQLSKPQAENLLRITEDEKRFGLYADGECYKSINALTQQKYANILIKFAKRILREKRMPDWRWSAFYVLGMLMVKKIKVKASPQFVKNLFTEAEKEENGSRRSQLIEIAEKFANFTNNKTAS